MPFKVLNFILSYPPANSFVSELEDTIYACLNPPSAAVSAGRAIALPRGRFQIQRILDQLPPGWQPDLISISSSLALTWQSPIPVGLDQLDYPTVMKLTDSHHMPRPLQNLLEYATVVGCDYHWTTYNRQHLPFFRAAGLANVFWMPGAMNIPTAQAQPVPLEQKKYDLIFLGSRGASHPYRDSLLACLEQSQLPVTVKRLPYQESLQAYAEAKIVFNCSLNGDLNRRVFETLMAGGFLLTDNLTPASGLPLIFQEGQHLECYRSADELLEKVRYYLAHPEQAVAIAQQGHAQMMHYHPEILRRQFYDYLLKGEPLPSAFLAEDLDDPPSPCPERLLKRIKLYELLQELHRLNSELTVLCYHDPEIDLVKDLSNLPRIRLTSVHSVEELVHQQQSFQILLIHTITSEAQGVVAELSHHTDFSVARYDLLILAGNIGTVRAQSHGLQTQLQQHKFMPIHVLTNETPDYLTFRNTLQPQGLRISIAPDHRTMQDRLISWLRPLKSLFLRK
jgi:hypothetical protein